MCYDAVVARGRHPARALLVSAADRGVVREAALWLGERGHRVLAGGADLGAMEDMPRETAPGGLVEIVRLDPDDSSDCEAAVARAVGLFGRLDGIVW